MDKDLLKSSLDFINPTFMTRFDNTNFYLTIGMVAVYDVYTEWVLMSNRGLDTLKTFSVSTGSVYCTKFCNFKNPKEKQKNTKNCCKIVAGDDISIFLIKDGLNPQPFNHIGC